MGYRGRKRRLKNFWQNAKDFLFAVDNSNQLDNSRLIKSEVSSRRHFFRAAGKKITGTRQRLAIKENRQHLIYALAYQDKLIKDLASRRFKPVHFSYVPFSARVVGELSVQEYFHKPNAEQLLDFLNAVVERRRNKNYKSDLTKKEYELCKKFAKNPINAGITVEKINLAVNEILEYFEISNVFENSDTHNVLIQGINRDGTLRVTLIDV
jgi:hypothetical protein